MCIKNLYRNISATPQASFLSSCTVCINGIEIACSMIYFPYFPPSSTVLNHMKGFSYYAKQVLINDKAMHRYLIEMKRKFGIFSTGDSYGIFYEKLSNDW